jgi:formate dehydrogenase major subunit
VAITAPPESRTVTLTIDGHEITVPEGATIWDAAKKVGIDIPALCHDDRYDPVGVCRLCVVDVGARVYAAACVRPCEEGMEVKTATSEVETRRATLTQLLLADQPPTEDDPKETTTGDNELLELARRYGLQREDGVPLGFGRGEDHSNPVISVNHDACILCDRCVRACDDIQGNDVIGRSGKGYTARIAFDLNDPMGESSCVTCGECVRPAPRGRSSTSRSEMSRSVPGQSSSRWRPCAPTAASAARSPTTSTGSETRSRTRTAASNPAHSGGCA